MPLPLPSLDNRRWSDLVAEGRALIPRHAPAWTDHNVHDPGIMLMELFAFLGEQLIYRANRIPERHLRKFLALTGFPPRDPRPAVVVLGAVAAPGSGAVTIPAGVLCTADAGTASALSFRVARQTQVLEIALATVQGFDGARFTDLTRIWRDGGSLQPLGTDPRPPRPYIADRAPALYLGFDAPVAPGNDLTIAIGMNASDWLARERLLEEQRELALECPSPTVCLPYAGATSASGDDSTYDAGELPVVPTEPATIVLTPHHSVRVVWEYAAADGWHRIDETGSLIDDTRALTLSGELRLRPGGVMGSRQLGVVAQSRYYLRARIEQGRFDATPVLASIVPNAVVAEQRWPAWRTFTVASGASVSGLLISGTRQPLRLTFDPAGVLQKVTVEPDDSGTPAVRVLSFTAPTAATAGSLTLELDRLDVGLGFPAQRVEIAGAPIAADTLSVRSLEPVAAGVATRRWTARDDLDASLPTDADFALNSSSGTLTFGNGVRGRMVPAGATIVAEYETTAGSGGNTGIDRPWAIADSSINRALLGSNFTVASTTALANPAPASRGNDAERVGDAMERAAAFLWSHERLVDLAERSRQETLDQLPRERVLALDAPVRATTVLDYERIAVDIPGTAVARARAFADFDPRVPCLDAPGTITVVIIPYLPPDRPVPSTGLIAAVSRSLDRRRLIATRVVVVGPTYVGVRVEASVQTLESADPVRVRADVIAALDDFLHPLRGGPAGLGWPFGRDVYRSEVLAVIDQVEGVDHVLSATLFEMRDGEGQAVQCGNVCVPPTSLVAPLPHVVEVVTG